jgi:hypothetical protein
MQVTSNTSPAALDFSTQMSHNMNSLLHGPRSMKLQNGQPFAFNSQNSSSSMDPILLGIAWSLSGAGTCSVFDISPSVSSLLLGVLEGDEAPSTVAGGEGEGSASATDSCILRANADPIVKTLRLNLCDSMIHLVGEVEAIGGAARKHDKVKMQD